MHLWHYLLFIFVISSISKSKEATFLRSWRLTHVYWPALAVVDRDTADWSKSEAAAEATSETTKHKTSWNWCKCKRERERDTVSIAQQNALFWCQDSVLFCVSTSTCTFFYSNIYMWTDAVYVLSQVCTSSIYQNKKYRKLPLLLDFPMTISAGWDDDDVNSAIEVPGDSAIRVDCFLVRWKGSVWRMI